MRISSRLARSPFLGALLAALLLMAAPGVLRADSANAGASWHDAPVAYAAPAAVQRVATGALAHRSSASTAHSPFICVARDATRIRAGASVASPRSSRHNTAAPVARGYDATAPPRLLS